jgi:enolase-phosphatase E1
MPTPVTAVLLDVEGTTSSISFVHDQMFPYARRHLRGYLMEHWGQALLRETLERLAADAGLPSAEAWLGDLAVADQPHRVIEVVEQWMDQDRKATGLKQLQGQIWQAGFESQQLVAHVWPDVPLALRQWQQAGIDIRIYSSGSIAAQKLFFGHTEVGNLLDCFSGHYDTTSGGKKESPSYRKIADDWRIDPRQIVFVSDVVEELEAAAEAGLRVLLSCRPGNPPQDPRFPCLRVESFPAITPWLG